jgi:hypothetical protein
VQKCLSYADMPSGWECQRNIKWSHDIIFIVSSFLRDTVKLARVHRIGVVFSRILCREKIRYASMSFMTKITSTNRSQQPIGMPGRLGWPLSHRWMLLGWAPVCLALVYSQATIDHTPVDNEMGGRPAVSRSSKPGQTCQNPILRILKP